MYYRSTIVLSFVVIALFVFGPAIAQAQRGGGQQGRKKSQQGNQGAGRQQQMQRSANCGQTQMAGGMMQGGMMQGGMMQGGMMQNRMMQGRMMQGGGQVDPQLLAQMMLKSFDKDGNGALDQGELQLALTAMFQRMQQMRQQRPGQGMGGGIGAAQGFGPGRGNGMENGAGEVEPNKRRRGGKAGAAGNSKRGAR